jgi:hypothetical protein
MISAKLLIATQSCSTKKQKDKNMIISDLNHLEVIDEAVEIIGGDMLVPTYDFYALADAGSAADAIGSISQTSTVTETGAVAGLFSSSLSLSSAFAAY